jgi:predicted nucleic acid-binding Zn ribbon protein
MPNFAFVCPDGHENERNYGFSDKKPGSITCSCGKKAKRQIRAPAIIFRGPGFTKSHG